jgi:hypothetical protein
MAIAFLPAKVVAGLSPLAQLVFVGQGAHFCWLFLPILAMMFLGGRQYIYDE